MDIHGSLPPFTPKIPSSHSRYLEPAGPLHLSYSHEQQQEQFLRRAHIRIRCPQDAGELLEREALRATLEEGLLACAERRDFEHLLAWKIRSVWAPLAPPHRRPELLALADALDNCRLHGVVGILPEPDGRTVFIWDDKCGLVRLCPDEARADAMRVASHYSPSIEAYSEAPGHRVFYLVFTSHNYRPGTLAAGHKDIQDRFKRFLTHSAPCTGVKFVNGKVKRGRPRKERSFPMVQGALTVMEDPLSADRSWNVHLNAILTVKGNFNYAEIRDVWGDNVHIQEVKSGKVAESMRELIKYAAKLIPVDGAKGPDPRTGRPQAPAMIEWTVDEFLEWLDAQKYRRVRAYGNLYAIDGKRWDAHNPMSARNTTRAKALSDQRLAWLKRARLDVDTIGVDYLLLSWAEIPSDAKPKLRAAIARPTDAMDISTAQWVGQMTHGVSGYLLEMSGDDRVKPWPLAGVDLITGDKSRATIGAEYASPTIQPEPARQTGPPGLGTGPPTR